MIARGDGCCEPSCCGTGALRQELTPARGGARLAAGLSLSLSLSLRIPTPAMPHPQPNAAAADWDRRYRSGQDGWELGQPAPPLQRFLRLDPRAPRPPATVLVPGCGRGHEAALLASLGFWALGLDVSGEALAEARRLHGPSASPGPVAGGGPGLALPVAGGPALAGEGRLRWLQADLFDQQALAAAQLTAGSLEGVLEHTCFCAIDPEQRAAYLQTMARLLRPRGWLLGLFWCHGRPGGPPWGSDPDRLRDQLLAAGFAPDLWEPASGSHPSRQQEWLGLWRRLP